MRSDQRMLRGLSLHFDCERRRIICRWGEPSPILWQGLPGTIYKTRSLSCLVTGKGRMSEPDRKRLSQRPQFGAIERFRRRLLEEGFPGKVCRPCEICGKIEGVNCHFHPPTGTIVHLCHDHESQLSELAPAKCPRRGAPFTGNA